MLPRQRQTRLEHGATVSKLIDAIKSAITSTNLLYEDPLPTYSQVVHFNFSLLKEASINCFSTY